MEALQLVQPDHTATGCGQEPNPLARTVARKMHRLCSGLVSDGPAYQFLNNRQSEHLGQFGRQGGAGPESLDFAPQEQSLTGGHERGRVSGDSTNQRLERGLKAPILPRELLKCRQLQGWKIQATGRRSASFEFLFDQLGHQPQVSIAHRLREQALVERPHQGLSPDVGLRRIHHSDGGRGIQWGPVSGQDQQTVWKPLSGRPVPDITEEMTKQHSRL